MPYNKLKAAQKLARGSSGRHPVPNFTVATGAAINTNVPVTGIRRGIDELVSVLILELPTSAAAFTVTDVTAEASITSDGNIQTTATSSATKQVLVIWYHVFTP